MSEDVEQVAAERASVEATPRRAAVLRISEELLLELLLEALQGTGIPLEADVRISGVKIDTFIGVVELCLESQQFPRVSEGATPETWMPRPCGKKADPPQVEFQFNLVLNQTPEQTKAAVEQMVENLKRRNLLGGGGGS